MSTKYPKFPKQKKRSIKSLKKECDHLMSLYVIQRDKRCIVCGSLKNLTNGHLFTRRYNAIRWSKINCNSQCLGCNFRHEFDPYPYTHWFLTKYGQDAYDRLHALGRAGVRLNKGYLRKVRDQILTWILELG